MIIRSPADDSLEAHGRRALIPYILLKLLIRQQSAGTSAATPAYLGDFPGKVALALSSSCFFRMLKPGSIKILRGEHCKWGGQRLGKQA